MGKSRVIEAFVLGLFICMGLFLAGKSIYKSAETINQSKRFVTVKGLAEREVKADRAIWPLTFRDGADDLNRLYISLEKKTQAVKEFLQSKGFSDKEYGVSAPEIVDRKAERYGSSNNNALRYLGSVTVTVYSTQVDSVVKAISDTSELVRKGVALDTADYRSRTEFLFTRLNDIKPGMIEQATLKAREAAKKFAEDSGSRLGKIRNARQGQFSISPRDSGTPYIKKVRVVNTLEYYLVD
ncbi:SIMPL domain-containing protein [Limisalsivibrio acetivorans]|uniref:SIMPL domain-containing protein n=1 Tax=Limisalsivibrio acetivorans TaxID=1304888 RepID=UPI0003B39F86|nr:SIMPL domain-containing protein [Limisalsivibrio acetivorans]